MKKKAYFQICIIVSGMSRINPTIRIGHDGTFDSRSANLLPDILSGVYIFACYIIIALTGMYGAHRD